MKRVRVIAPMGATIRGAARLVLSPDQANRRASVLVKTKRSGVYELPDGVAVTFKLGEEFQTDALPKLNPALFEDMDAAEAAAKAEKKAKAKADAEAEADDDDDAAAQSAGDEAA